MEAQHFGRVVFEHDDPFIRLSPLALASPDTFAELDSAHPTFVLIKSSKVHQILVYLPFSASSRLTFSLFDMLPRIQVNMELPRDDFSVRDLNVDRVNAEEIEQLQRVRSWQGDNHHAMCHRRFWLFPNKQTETTASQTKIIQTLLQVYRDN